MQTVIQTSEFLADCRRAGLSEDIVSAMVVVISAEPEAGIPGTGGARKRRFAGRGKGKSGGYRTVAYFAGDLRYSKSTNRRDGKLIHKMEMSPSRLAMRGDPDHPR
jgi:hypothetical protein